MIFSFPIFKMIECKKKHSRKQWWASGGVSGGASGGVSGGVSGGASGAIGQTFWKIEA
jgi:hypothetical protein